MGLKEDVEAMEQRLGIEEGVNLYEIHQLERAEIMASVDPNYQFTPEEAAASKKIADMMMRDTIGNKALKDKLQVTHKEKQKELAELRKQANMAKKEKEYSRAKKKAAQQKLKEIEKQRREAAKKGGLNTVDDPKEDLYKDTLSNARGRHILTGMVNESSLGTTSERTDPDKCEYPDSKNNPNFEPLQFKTDNGIMRGAKYTPEGWNPKTGKVAVVYTGSHEPGAAQIKDIKDTYLAQGIAVVQVDYRGFGNSRSTNIFGMETNTWLTEEKLYKDGMDIYHHVKDTMGINPNNIVLHGYSLGGAVASRVALEATKELNRERIANGKIQKEGVGLGGVVLHSPMKSLQYAAHYDSGSDFMAWGAKTFGGQYNTEQHMLDLAKVDKNVPVHLIGGDPNINVPDDMADQEQPDFLDPNATGLKGSIEEKFSSCTYTQGKGGHMGKIGGSNITAADQHLRDIAEKGRNLTSQAPVKQNAVGAGPN